MEPCMVQYSQQAILVILSYSHAIKKTKTPSDYPTLLSATLRSLRFSVKLPGPSLLPQGAWSSRETIPQSGVWVSFLWGKLQNHKAVLCKTAKVRWFWMILKSPKWLKPERKLRIQAGKAMQILREIAVSWVQQYLGDWLSATNKCSRNPSLQPPD